MVLCLYNSFQHSHSNRVPNYVTTTNNGQNWTIFECGPFHDYRELLIEHLGAEKFVPKMKLVTQRDAQDFAKKTKSGKNCLACALLDKFFQWQRKNNPRAFNDLSS